MAMLYLVGDPVAHSLSPAMQNAAFAALGLPHRYELLRTRSDDIASAVARIRGEDVLGANVTIPHKEHIGRLLDAIEDTARRIGAVNTIFKRGGALRGDNTDAGGFTDGLAEKGIDVRGRQVLLLGAGGAARACAAELIASGAHVQISNRGPVRLQELARALPAMVEGLHSYAAIWPPPRSLDGFDVFVNATSLGLSGEDALEEIALPADVAVIDVVATAHETPLIRRAREAGCLAVDGLVMLLHQGARAFRLWTGLDAPLAAMRAALPRAV